MVYIFLDQIGQNKIKTIQLEKSNISPQNNQ